jgi:hypothetical protein
MTDDEYFLTHEAVTAHQWRGLKALRAALSEFEPLAKRVGIGEIVAEQLVALRLAEKGPAPARYGGTGYRLGDLGWKVIERGSRPKGKRIRARRA